MITTRTSAASSVLKVSRRNTSVKAVVSSPRTQVTPFGRRFIHSSSSSLTLFTVVMAFASGDLYTLMKNARLSSKRERVT